MGGKSSKPVIGYWYKLLLHLGIGRGPIDAIREFRGGEKTAWSGRLESGSVEIDAEDLWGGEEKEGGIVGTLTLLPGEADQDRDATIVANLGDDDSAFRGRASVVFNGRYGAFNPYPKPASFLVERLLKGWEDGVVWQDGLVAIPFAETTINLPLSVYFALDCSDSMNDIVNDPLTRLDVAKAAIVATLDFLIGYRAANQVRLDVGVAGWNNSHTDLYFLDASAADLEALKTFVMALGTVLNTRFDEGIIPALEFFEALNAAGVSGTPRKLFFITDGIPFPAGTDDDAAALAADLLDRTGDYTVAAGTAVDCYGINLELADTSHTAKLDNTPADGVPVIDDGDTDSLIAAFDFAGTPFSGFNPAHILYDTITSLDMQGEPTDLVDETSFLAAASRLYGEGFALATKYDPKSETVEAFQQRIEAVIGGALSQSRVDGKYHLMLIRDDYDLESLPILTDDDILEYEEEPSDPLEAVNQVVVDWFDPIKKQKRSTTPLQSLGAIESVGGIIPETASYPEIPYEDLALRVAARDLSLKASLQSRFRLTTNRIPYAWLRGQLFRLQAPRRGHADLVCLLNEVDAGVPRSASMRLVATQHVGVQPATVAVAPEPGVDTTPPGTATAPAAQQVVEAPYVELAGRLAPADLAALEADAGLVLVMAKRPTAGLNYALYTAADGEDFEQRGTGDWCATALVVESATQDPAETDFTLSGATDLDEVLVGMAALWGSELVRVDAIDANAGTVSFGRACGDTVPWIHTAGERVWFYDGGAASDNREYADGELVHAKVATRTGSQEMLLVDCTDLTVTMDSRAARPYPPADFQIEGAVPDGTAQTETITISWAHRDRTAQADQLVDTTEAGIGPEPGTRYTLQVIDASDDSVIVEQTDLVGPSVDVLLPIDYAGIRIEVWATRDGLASWQRQVSPAFAYTAGTEGSDWGIANPGEPGLIDGDTEVAGDDLFAVAGGTADALTADFDPDLTLEDGTQAHIRAAFANTGAATLAVDGGAAIALTKFGGEALSAGSIAGEGHELIVRYRLSVPRWELLNPSAGGDFVSKSDVATQHMVAPLETDSYFQAVNGFFAGPLGGGGSGVEHYGVDGFLWNYETGMLEFGTDDTARGRILDDGTLEWDFPITMEGAEVLTQDTIDDDETFTADSAVLVPSQRAVKQAIDDAEINGTNMDLTALPHLVQQFLNRGNTLFQWGVYQAAGAENSGWVTTQTNTGSLNAVTNASPAHSPQDTTKIFRIRPRRRYISAAGAGQSSGSRPGQLHVIPDFGTEYSIGFGHADVATVADARCFYGYIGSTALVNTDPSNFTDCCGVGADHGDANMSVLHNDGSGTCTKIPLGANFPANDSDTTPYELTVRFDPAAGGTVTASVFLRNLNNGAEHTELINTNLPSGSTPLGYRLWRNTGATTLLTVEIHFAMQQLTPYLK